MIFYQGTDDLIPWRRARRIGVAAKITDDHLLASSAIPFVFKAIKIHREYFGDGSMRQIAPISPALHLGAKKVLVIGVRRDELPAEERAKTQGYPSLAQVAGYALDSIFLDSLEADLERLQRINKTLGFVDTEHLNNRALKLQPVDVFVISPSEDIPQIAARYMHELPKTLRLLLRGVGALNKNGATFLSYLLFEKGYCRELIDMGYRDTLRRKDEVLTFLGHSTP
ncbi:MAG: NTE family protein [Halothiobacillaceae bacterium]|nr:MAG: NTE family protein [Halothiobacillaceae bacterium]